MEKVPVLTSAMATYTSNRLTIDTKLPVIKVTKIKNHSANKDDTYSFSITATDINMNAGAFNPTLSAVIMKEDGTFTSETISLGNMATVKDGEEYRFTVNNLERDAI